MTALAIILSFAVFIAALVRRMRRDIMYASYKCRQCSVVFEMERGGIKYCPDCRDVVMYPHDPRQACQAAPTVEDDFELPAYLRRKIGKIVEGR
jgi:DNA-directed RNA polymerase subunit RPC12/RpoP